VTQENADALALAGVSVRVTSGGSTVDAWVMSVSEKKIEALLPLHAALGEGKVDLTVNGVALSTSIRVVEHAFGIESSRVKVGAPGELAQVRGTGLGRELTPVGVEVLLAGNVVPAGGASRMASGWEVISFDVPEGLRGCAIPLAIRTGAVLSNFSTLSVGECPGEDPAPAETRVGGLMLSRTESEFSGMKMKIDSGDGWFQKTAFAQSGRAVTTGACTLVYAIEQDIATPPFTGLDAGMLEVSGPAGTREIERQSLGAYSSMLGQQMDITPPIPGFPNELFLTPGDYTFTGSGGADVGPFTTQVRVPEAAIWKNRGDVATVDRSRDLRIEWTNATEEQIVTVTGISVAGQRPAVAAIFTCTERGDKGALTVPAAILSALPATPAKSGDSAMMMGVSSINPATFTAEGLDRGTAEYTQSIMNATKYK
jgi:hypothetical protein